MVGCMGCPVVQEMTYHDGEGAHAWCACVCVLSLGVGWGGTTWRWTCFRKAFFLSLLQQNSCRTATPGLRESLYRHVDHRINGQDQSGTYQPTRHPAHYLSLSAAASPGWPCTSNTSSQQLTLVAALMAPSSNQCHSVMGGPLGAPHRSTSLQQPCPRHPFCRQSRTQATPPQSKEMWCP